MKGRGRGPLGHQVIMGTPIGGQSPPGNRAVLTTTTPLCDAQRVWQFVGGTNGRKVHENDTYHTTSANAGATGATEVTEVTEVTGGRVSSSSSSSGSGSGKKPAPSQQADTDPAGCRANAEPEEPDKAGHEGVWGESDDLGGWSVACDVDTADYCTGAWAEGAYHDDDDMAIYVHHGAERSTAFDDMARPTDTEATATTTMRAAAHGHGLSGPVTAERAGHDERAAVDAVLAASDRRVVPLSTLFGQQAAGPVGVVEGNTPGHPLTSQSYQTLVQHVQATSLSGRPMRLLEHVPAACTRAPRMATGHLFGTGMGPSPKRVRLTDAHYDLPHARHRPWLPNVTDGHPSATYARGTTMTRPSPSAMSDDVTAASASRLPDVLAALGQLRPGCARDLHVQSVMQGVQLAQHDAAGRSVSGQAAGLARGAVFTTCLDEATVVHEAAQRQLVDAVVEEAMDTLVRRVKELVGTATTRTKRRKKRAGQSGAAAVTGDEQRVSDGKEGTSSVPGDGCERCGTKGASSKVTTKNRPRTPNRNSGGGGGGGEGGADSTSPKGTGPSVSIGGAVAKQTFSMKQVLEVVLEALAAQRVGLSREYSKMLEAQRSQLVADHARERQMYEDAILNRGHPDRVDYIR